MTVLIVGGGIGGLRVANQLLQKYGTRAVVIERSPRVGGRVRSEYDGDTLLYEGGPWRIPSTHKRMIRLARDLGLQLDPLPFSTPPHGTLDEVQGLSAWEASLFFGNPPLACDAADLASGYAGLSHCASGSSPYSADTDTYFTVKEGFQRGILDALARGLDVRLNTRVVDVLRLPSGKYRIACRQRRDRIFETVTFDCDELFLCVPPSATLDWTIVRQWGLAQVHAVSYEPLQHIYAKSKTPLPYAFHVIRPTTALAQIISPIYAWSEWFQASYSGGRVAHFWHRLRMINPLRFVEYLKSELWRYVSVDIDDDVRVHHTEIAYHTWKPAPNFSLNKAVATAVMPHPTRLPRVYWVGEAFSSFQGWMEGALETADLAVNLSKEGYSYMLPTRLATRNEVVVDDRIVSVDAFMQGHPGGDAPLRDHMGEDVSELFRHIGHSHNAWSVVFNLQDGMLAESA
jgi:hypothetical protein